MTITNLGTLRSACESWMERALDAPLFQEFAQAVSDKLERGVLAPDGRTWIVPPLRVRAMEADGALTVTDGEAALPADWLEFKRLWLDDDAQRAAITYLPLSELNAQRGARGSERPLNYTIDGSAVLFATTGDYSVQGSWYEQLGALSGDADTNAILTAHPRVYRHGCLAEAFEWEGNFERAEREAAQFSAAVRALNGENEIARTRGGPLMMRRSSNVA